WPRTPEDTFFFSSRRRHTRSNFSLSRDFAAVVKQHHESAFDSLNAKRKVHDLLRDAVEGKLGAKSDAGVIQHREQMVFSLETFYLVCQFLWYLPRELGCEAFATTASAHNVVQRRRNGGA